MQKPETSSPPATALSTESEASTNQRLEYAAERARLLLGCYRKGDANDPETYVAAITAILAEYEPDVMKRATDPRTGLPRKLKFMPNPAEVAEECDLAKSIIAGERLIAKRAAEGFRWVDDRANSRLGFYDEKGNAYGARHKLPALPMPKERVAEVTASLSLPVMEKGPAYEPRGDGKHYGRIAADLDARRKRNADLSTEQDQLQKTA